MKTLLSASLILMTLMLGACTGSERQDVGIGGGAILGGIAGSAIGGGSVAGAVVGAAVGGVAGHELAK